MTTGKMTAICLGFVGCFALGVWTGPHITQRADETASAVHETVAVPPAQDEAKATDAVRSADADATRVREALAKTRSSGDALAGELSAPESASR